MSTAAQKAEAEYKASEYIRKAVFNNRRADFDMIYQSGVLFPLLTREEVKEIYDTMFPAKQVKSVADEFNDGF